MCIRDRATAVWVNRNIEIKGLYMDDLYFWSCYGEQGFLQYVFPLGSTRFRFLYYLAAWLEMAVVGNHVNWFVPFNILLNTAVSCSVYLIGRRLSRSKGIGFLCGFMYLMSRMAYYQIGQVLGLMETCLLYTSGTGMFEMAEGRFDVDKAHSFMVGDKLLDVEAGKNYGLASILVGTGYGREQHEEDMKTGLSPAYDFYAETLPDAARWILGKGQV